MNKSQDDSKKVDSSFKLYIAIDIVILILVIVIPFYLVRLNQEINGCGHHMFSSTGLGAQLWMLGRSLGFTCFIWFCLTAYRGFTTKKIAKKFHSMKKAKNLHCLEALITIIILTFHVITLITSEPWKSIILNQRVRHFSYSIYVLKLWTGIIFAIVMIATSIFFILMKDVKRVKKFGYKRMIWVKRFMLLFTVLLAVHIFLINTELWLVTIAGHIED